MSRAGLIYIIVSTVCISLVASVPLPELRPRNVVEHFDEYDNDLIFRTLVTEFDREFGEGGPEYENEYLSRVLGDHEVNMEDRDYVKREYDDPFTLEERAFNQVEKQYSKHCNFDVSRISRRSFWGMIKSGFKKAGSAIGNGFHKVQSSLKRAGGSIRNNLRKVGGAIRNSVQRTTGAIRNSIRKVQSGVRRVGATIRNNLRKVGGAIRSSVHRASGAMRNGLRRVKSGIQKAGRAIKSGFQRAGRAVKKGFQKVKQGFQRISGAVTNAEKVAKFGLKVAAAAASVTSKVVKFVPGIGTGVGIALKGAAIGADEVSNRIPVSLGSQLDKVSEGMDYVISPMGSFSKLAANAKGPGGQALAVAESLLL